jgi:hypothetical protein
MSWSEDDWYYYEQEDAMEKFLEDELRRIAEEPGVIGDGCTSSIIR